MRKQGRILFLPITVLFSALPVLAADESVTGAASGMSEYLPVMVGGGIDLVLLLILIIELAIKRKKKRKQNDEAAQDLEKQKTCSAVLIEAEVYTGTLQDPGVLRLVDTLTIGSAEGSDLKFAGEDMAANAAKLVLREDQVYLTEANPGTLLGVGGVRIYEESAVRSGDVLSVGDAEFMLRFPVK